MKKTLSIPADKEYLSRAQCLKKAQEIFDLQQISGMSVKQIAYELFAHACVANFCRKLKKLGLPTDYLIERADPIDMADGGDFADRKFLFFIFWYLPHPLMAARK